VQDGETLMLWSDDVLKQNSHDMKRLWLAGTIAAGLVANGQDGDWVAAKDAVELADLILEELKKEKL
jgi:frataxin-like iron-binding protein CyaY